MTNVIQRNVQVATRYHTRHEVASQRRPLDAAQMQHNRAIMLERVHSSRIKDLLEPSFHGASPLTLKLRLQPDAISDPYRTEQQASNSSHPRTYMLQVYADADGQLLILGSPGSGKTTLLLELVRDLLNLAAHNETHPIPVVFNLSAWTIKQPPMSLWFIEELEQKYLVPRSLAATWIESNQLLPLLDGLDEVSAFQREACISAINSYHQAHDQTPLVVCSRSAEYLAHKTRLQLRHAVAIQPLTLQQVDAYLANTGEELQGLRLALHSDPSLRSLIKTPLLLTVLTHAYQGRQVKSLTPTDGPVVQRQQILHTYVQRMFERRTRHKYRQEQIIHGLTWLAKQVTSHHQTEFLMEEMQPDWLTGRKERTCYERLGVQLPSMLIGMALCLVVWLAVTDLKNYGTTNNICYTMLLIGGIGGLIGAWFSKERNTPRLIHRYSREWLQGHVFPAVRIGLLVALSSGFLYRLMYHDSSLQSLLLEGASLGVGSFLLDLLVSDGLIGKVRSQINRTSWKTSASSLLTAGHLRNGVIIGAIYSLSLCSGNFGHLPKASLPPLTWLIYGFLFAISTTILSMIHVNMQDTIEPLEILTWSWENIQNSFAAHVHLKHGLFIGTGGGLLCGLCIGLTSMGGWQEGLLYTLCDGLTIGLGYWLFRGLFQGLRGKTLAATQRIFPNQRIHLSIRNSFLIGVVSASMSGCLSFLNIILRNSLLRNMAPSTIQQATLGCLVVGMAIGMTAGLLQGGIAGLRHAVLRVLLWLTACAPLNYPSFLNEAARCTLLNKVGGSYIFPHQLLLDYFAALETGSAPEPDSEPDEDLETQHIPRLVSARRAYRLSCGHTPRPGAHFCTICGKRI